MHQRIIQRLAELDQEFEQGNARLVRMETERAELKETLLRIQGAVMVLKEFSAAAGQQGSPDETGGESAEIIIPEAPGDEAVEDK